MGFYLVQQWWVLPNIGERLQMGDGTRVGGYLPSTRTENMSFQGRGDGGEEVPPSLGLFYYPNVRIVLEDVN